MAIARVGETYATARSGSGKLFERASHIFPGGLNHDMRYAQPFPIYYARGLGSHKWDVDGNDYIDYSMGSAALLLGHCHPAAIEAIVRQLERSTHFGAAHDLEVEWGELIQRLVPSAQRVRFVNSGTEATMLAIRLARAYTGHQKIVRFEGHYHGWHDYAVMGMLVPFYKPASIGVPPSSLATTIVVPANDIKAVEAILANEEDIACVILEPSGASFGNVPLRPGFLKDLRELTLKYQVPLIFDEVITGFRYSPGGVQGLTGVIPDLTTMAKILAGGLPGGAVAGRADIMGVLEYKGNEDRDRHQRVYHGGTFNANPLAAAAGIATLKIVATGEPQKRADMLAQELREGMNRVINKLGIAACVYGDSSTFHIYPGARSIEGLGASALKGVPTATIQSLRQNLQVRGIDLLSRLSGVTSAAHTEEDIARTLEAFEEALKTVAAEGLLKG